eukprot:TRINITY_DN74802_c0_g1_i1.p1 TRINITY_DN74802_c0_g1~~TRINITY_DN74802_c0_g1_i1.p1  ORF type:complete len:361 (+),score=24.55 TRINITY_DN74802_c0_g1_i1:55-1137(+)
MLSQGLDVDKLQEEAESSKHRADPMESEIIDDLWKWVLAHGGECLESIRPSYFVHAGVLVRGVAATRDIPAGTAIFKIPQAVILHKSHPTVLGSNLLNRIQLGSDILRKPRTAFHEWALPIFLAEQRLLGEESFWWPMIRALPALDDYEKDHCLCAHCELLSCFVSLPLVGNLQREQKHMHEAWQHVLQHAGTIEVYKRTGDVIRMSWRDFQWSCLVWRSRAFGCRRNGCALVPILDLINAGMAQSNMCHTRGPDFKTYAKDDCSICVESEVLHSYQASSKKNNEHFARTYGFVLQGNPSLVRSLGIEATADLRTALSKGYSIAKELGQLNIWRTLARLSVEHCSELRGELDFLGLGQQM